MLDILAADLRYAQRTFRRSPGFAAPAVVSLAVGIAAATGLFSIVNAALLNPFPFADIDRIVTLDMTYKGRPRGLSVTVRELVALQQSDVLDGAFCSRDETSTRTTRWTGRPSRLGTTRLRGGSSLVSIRWAVTLRLASETAMPRIRCARLSASCTTFPDPA